MDIVPFDNLQSLQRVIVKGLYHKKIAKDTSQYLVSSSKDSLINNLQILNEAKLIAGFAKVLNGSDARVKSIMKLMYDLISVNVSDGLDFFHSDGYYRSKQWIHHNTLFKNIHQLSKKYNLRLRWHDSNPFKLLLANLSNCNSIQCEKRQAQFYCHVSSEELSHRMSLSIATQVPFSFNTELEKTLMSTKGMGPIKTFYYGYPRIQDMIHFAFPQYWRELDADLIATDGSKRKGELGAGCGLAWEPNQGINCQLLGTDNVFPAELIAILIAITLSNDKQDLVILTDSESAISAIDKYSNSWEFKLPSSTLPYGQILSHIHWAIQARTFHVHFLWTKSHSNSTDQLSILNKEADRQANSYPDGEHPKPQLAIIRNQNLIDQKICRTLYTTTCP